VSQLVRAFLYGVSPGAPHIFAIAAAVLVVSAVLATLVPARRAAAMDPMLALKE
jgi:ABC-type antimicrobial peptide transport system permease subunit